MKDEEMERPIHNTSHELEYDIAHFMLYAPRFGLDIAHSGGGRPSQGVAMTQRPHGRFTNSPSGNSKGREEVLMIRLPI